MKSGRADCRPEARQRPLSYRVRDGGRQFVVIAAGGHNQMQTTRGDSVVAFALPETRSAAR